MTVIDNIRAAKSLFENSLISRTDVLGIAVGHRSVAGEQTDEACVKIFVARKIPRAFLANSLLLPQKLQFANGIEVRTDVEEMSPWQSPPLLTREAALAANYAANQAFRAGRAISPAIAEPLRQPEIVRRAIAPFGGVQVGAPQLHLRLRPALGGASIAHYRFINGTLTSGVRDANLSNVTYLLSCSHVMALAGLANVGDPILQPASGSGGIYPADCIGFLTRFVPLDSRPFASNQVDAGIAVTNPNSVFVAQVANVGGIQGIEGTSSLTVGQQVQSVGCVTGLLTGYVIAVNATLKVSYAALGLRAGIFTFRNQILTTPMSAFGDSGALLLDGNGNALGMLFTGSLISTGYNPIELVQSELGIIIAGSLQTRSTVSEPIATKLTNDVKRTRTGSHHKNDRVNDPTSDTDLPVAVESREFTSSTSFGRREAHLSDHTKNVAKASIALKKEPAKIGEKESYNLELRRKRSNKTVGKPRKKR